MTTTKAKILWNDVSDDAVFSGPSWSPSIQNIQDPRPSFVARSINADPANSQFDMEFDDPVSMDALIIAGTNLDVDATYRIRAFSDATLTTVVHDTGTQAVWLSAMAISDPDLKGIPLIALFTSTVTAKYWRTEITDPGNADGFIELGKVFNGVLLDTDFTIAVGANFVRDANTSTNVAVAGTPYFNRHQNIRTWTIRYPTESYSTAWDEFDRMIEVCGIDKLLFVIPFPDDVDRFNQHSFLCTIARQNGLDFIGGDAPSRVSTGFELREYLA